MPKGRKFGGRKAGTPNKVPSELRDMVLAALSQAGGIDYLRQQATDSPGPFLALVGKCLPRDLNVSGEIRHTLETMILDAVQRQTAETRVQ